MLSSVAQSHTYIYIYNYVYTFYKNVTYHIKCNFPPLGTLYGRLSPKQFSKHPGFQGRGCFPAQSRITLISQASLCVPDVHVEHCAGSPRFLRVFFFPPKLPSFWPEPEDATAAAFLAGCAESLRLQLRSSRAAEHTVQGGDATQGRQAAFR